MNVKRLARGPILWVLLAVVLLVLAFSTLRVPTTQRIDTSDGMALLAGETVEQVKITEGVQRVDMTLSEPFVKDEHDYGTQVQFFYVTPQGPAVVDAIDAADPPKGVAERYTARQPRRVSLPMTPRGQVSCTGS